MGTREHRSSAEALASRRCRRRGVGFGEGVSPSPMGDFSGEGAVPPHSPLPETFSIFRLKIVHFGVYSDKNSQFISPIARFKKYM